jgi:hypothetical protein
LAVKAKLRFPGDLPWDKEYKLINEGGFVVFARKRNEWLILEKQVKKQPPKTFEVLMNGKLPEDIQLSLRRRCNSVVSLYADPDAHVKAIRNRIENIAATLPKHQAKFLTEWMMENLDD